MSPTLARLPCARGRSHPWLLSRYLLRRGRLSARLAIVLRRRDASALACRPASRRFSAGWRSIYLALASPIEPFAALSAASAHGAALAADDGGAAAASGSGAPLLPLLRGLPEPMRTYWVAPLLAIAPACASRSACLTHPFVALPLLRRHDLAVAHSGRLRLALALKRLALWSSMFAFWRRLCCSGIPVVRPYPSRPRWSRWLLVALSDCWPMCKTRCCRPVLTFSRPAAVSVLRRKCRGSAGCRHSTIRQRPAC